MKYKYFRMELYRIFSSYRFWLIILLMTATMFGSISEYILAAIKYPNTKEGTAIFEKIFEILVFDRFKALIILFSSGIAAYTVSDDITSKFSREILGRISLEDYVLVKVIVNLISILSSIIAAFSLFTVILLLAGVPAIGEPSFLGFYESVVSAFPVLYIPLSAILFGTFAAAMTTAGMFVTAIYPGRYLNYALPFGLFYILVSISNFLPREISLFYICSGVQVLRADGFLINYIYGIGIFLFMIFIFGCSFYLVMKRRVRNGRY